MTNEHGEFHDRIEFHDPIDLPQGADTALKGLRDAIARLRDASLGVLQGKGLAPVSVALSEALWWIGAFDAYFPEDPDFERRHGTKWRDLREQNEDAEFIGALAFARHRAAHGLLLVAMVEVWTMPGVGGSVEHPREGSVVVHVPMAEAGFQLVWSTDPPAGRSVHERQMYMDRLAGQPVGDSLRHAADIIEGLIVDP